MNTLEHSKKLRELLKQLVRNLGILEKSEASCCGITLGQCHALVEIGNAKEISLNDLADILGLDNSTTSRTVNNLVNQDMVERETDPNDRRYIKIKLTKAGEETFHSIEESMEEYFSLVLQSIAEEKRAQVIESLQLIVQAVKNHKCC
ncbi:MAG: MarR family winged helix-turn-helix transcriptional regulator [Bacillota bacterium]